MLRTCGFPTAEICNGAGYTSDELREAGFSAAELREHMGLTAKELKEGGYSVTEIKAAGFELWRLKGIGM